MRQLPLTARAVVGLHILPGVWGLCRLVLWWHWVDLLHEQPLQANLELDRTTTPLASLQMCCFRHQSQEGAISSETSVLLGGHTRCLSVMRPSPARLEPHHAPLPIPPPPHSLSILFSSGWESWLVLGKWPLSVWLSNYSCLIKSSFSEPLCSTSCQNAIFS